MIRKNSGSGFHPLKSLNPTMATEIKMRLEFGFQRIPNQ